MDSHEELRRWARLRQIFLDAGVYRPGHFVGASGVHLDGFYHLEPFMDDHRPECMLQLDEVAIMMALAIHEQGLKPNFVMGPANGGNAIARLVAAHLSQVSQGNVPAIITEKTVTEIGSFRILDGQPNLEGCQVIVVDDVMTRGGTCGRVVDLCRQAGATVIGVAVMVCRSSLTAAELGVPVFLPLMRVQAPSYAVTAGERCPMCEAGTPVDQQLGHGAAFVARVQSTMARIESGN